MVIKLTAIMKTETLTKANLLAQNVKGMDNIIHVIGETKGITDEQRESIISAIKPVRDDLERQFDEL